MTLSLEKFLHRTKNKLELAADGTEDKKRGSRHTATAVALISTKDIRGWRNQESFYFVMTSHSLMSKANVAHSISILGGVIRLYPLHRLFCSRQKTLDTCNNVRIFLRFTKARNSSRGWGKTKWLISYISYNPSWHERVKKNVALKPKM